MTFVVLPGDGIGPAVVEQALRVLDAVGFEEPRVEQPFGVRAFLERGATLPAETVAALRAHRLALLGAGGTAHEAAQPSSILELRRALGLDVLVRPVAIGERDVTLVCASFEGLYGQADEEEKSDVVVHRRVVTLAGLTRLLEAAGARATRSIHVVDKPSVFHRTRALWERALAAARPAVGVHVVNADAFAASLVRDPGAYDVVVALSFVGDVLSDLLAALGDGVGAVASAALGDEVAVFEPVHGTAPRRAGEDPLRVNPVGAVRAAALLLAHCGEHERARAVEAAVRDKTRPRTPDEGGGATTREVGDALLARLRSAGR